MLPKKARRHFLRSAPVRRARASQRLRLASALYLASIWKFLTCASVKCHLLPYTAPDFAIHQTRKHPTASCPTPGRCLDQKGRPPECLRPSRVPEYGTGQVRAAAQTRDPTRLGFMFRFLSRRPEGGHLALCVQRYGPLPAPTKVLFTKFIISRRCSFARGTPTKCPSSARSPLTLSLFYDLPPSLNAVFKLRAILCRQLRKLAQGGLGFLDHTSDELGRVDGASETYTLSRPQRHELRAVLPLGRCTDVFG